MCCTSSWWSRGRELSPEPQGLESRYGCVVQCSIVSSPYVYRVRWILLFVSCFFNSGSNLRERSNQKYVYHIHFHFPIQSDLISDIRPLGHHPDTCNPCLSKMSDVRPVETLPTCTGHPSCPMNSLSKAHMVSVLKQLGQKKRGALCAL